MNMSENVLICYILQYRHMNNFAGFEICHECFLTVTPPSVHLYHQIIHISSNHMIPGMHLDDCRVQSALQHIAVSLIICSIHAAVFCCSLIP